MFTYDRSHTSEAVVAALELISEDFPIAVKGPWSSLHLRFKLSNGPVGFTTKGSAYEITGATLPQMLRSLASLRGFMETGHIPKQHHETAAFDTLGLMLDVSRNGVATVGFVKLLLRRMALMGMNMLQLYAEETYEVPGQPYIGYLRGRYTQAEQKELDDYAHTLGIEMVPCIQTLGHLAQMLRWPEYTSVKDTDDILLVDEPKTYELIEEMVKAAYEPYRSKRIHIGMDEAHGLGLGRYLQLHGPKKRFDLMNKHLGKVVEITRKFGLKPMMWSDMYFRLGSKNDDYYDWDAIIPKGVAKNIPKDVQLIYWDYYHPDKEFYLEWIDRHRKLGSEPVFAPGLWTWHGMWLNFTRTRVDVDAGMAACREKGVREAITTSWFDDGAECDPMSMFPGLQHFADSGYCSKVTDQGMARTFKGSCGTDMADWLLGCKLDETPGLESMAEHFQRIGWDMPKSVDRTMVSDGKKWVLANPSKFILWQDPLLGLCDEQIRGIPLTDHYRTLAKDLRKALKKDAQVELSLTYALRLAEVLELKADLGIRLLDAYAARDTAALEELQSKVLPKIIARVKRLREAHRNIWFATRKANGWEALDRRYGGITARLESTAMRLGDYLSGKIDKIEELEEKRLPCCSGREGRVPDVGMTYNGLVGPSVIV